MDDLLSYVDVLQSLHIPDRWPYTFGELVRDYPSTTEVNEVLYSETDFQFPVITGDSQEDIIAYHLSIVEENHTDEVGDLDVGGVELGAYIDSSYDCLSILYRDAVFSLTGRLQSQPGEHANKHRYLIRLFHKLYEELGPWSLCGYYGSYTVYWGGSDNEISNLYTSLGIEYGMVYFRYPVPGREFMLKELTDRASSSVDYCSWLISSGDDQMYSDKSIVLACVCMTLSKSYNRSLGRQAFVDRFDSLLRVCVRESFMSAGGEDYSTDPDPLPMLHQLCKSINDGLHLQVHRHFKLSLYKTFIFKTIFYAEKVYRMNLMDVIARWYGSLRDLLR